MRDLLTSMYDFVRYRDIQSARNAAEIVRCWCRVQALRAKLWWLEVRSSRRPGP